MCILQHSGYSNISDWHAIGHSALLNDRSKDQTQYHIPFLLEGAVFGEWERFFWLKGTCLSKVKQSLQRPSDFQKMPRKIMEEISGQAN